MVASREETISIRELLSHLDSDMDPESRKLYESLRKEYIKSNEIIKGKEKNMFIGLPDPDGNITIGIGFNMSDKNALREWNEAFKTLPAGQKPSFNLAKSGVLKLSEHEVDLLFSHSVNSREKNLRELYAGIWEKLKLNERLTIEDANYNTKTNRNNQNKLVGKHTDFYANIKLYTETGNQKYLEYAIWEIRRNSNSNRYDSLSGQGLENRRITEASMLNTYRINIEAIETPQYVREFKVVKEAIGQLSGIIEKEALSKEDVHRLVSEMSDSHLEVFKSEVRKKLKRDITVSDAKLKEKIKEIEDRYNKEISELKEETYQKIEQLFKDGSNKGLILNELPKISKEYQDRIDKLKEEMEIVIFQKLEEYRQREAGFTHYRWVTSHDNKVRESHILNDGRIFSWGRPPERTGHPGEDYNCRCHAEIVTDQEILSQERQEAKTLQELHIFLKNPPIVPFIYANK